MYCSTYHIYLPTMFNTYIFNHQLTLVDLCICNITITDKKQGHDKMKIAPPGFEPGTRAPKARMIDRYTTGLRSKRIPSGGSIPNIPVRCLRYYPQKGPRYKSFQRNSSIKEVAKNCMENAIPAAIGATRYTDSATAFNLWLPRGPMSEKFFKTPR